MPQSVTRPSFDSCAASSNNFFQTIEDKTMFRVKYYDEKKSHKGQGVQVRTFDDRQAAEEFAAKHQLYSRPCTVEEPYDEKQQESTGPLHIVELNAENVMRLKAVRIRPDGQKMIVVGGENAQGKSSLLSSIEMLLGGGKTIPGEPVRRGQRKARIVADFGDIVVERTFSAKGTALEVRNADGVPQKSPQALLDSLCAKVAFDPLSFAREEPKKQDAILKQILGLDFSDLDTRREKAFAERRDLNRDVKTKAAQLSGMLPHIGVPAEEVSVAELTQELENARDIWDENRNRKVQLETAIDQAGDTRIEISNAQTKIKELERDLREKKKLVEELRAQQIEEEKTIEDLKQKVEALEWPELEPIKTRIATAETTNRKVRENKQRKALAAELDLLETQVDHLNDQIEEIDAEKQARLEAAKFPVPGLGFDDTGPTLNGIPLDQASQAERLRVSIAIGAALNPRIRVMLVRDASLLDAKAMELMAQFAEEHNVQLWMERVGTGDPSALVIEDGELRDVAESAAE